MIDFQGFRNGSCDLQYDIGGGICEMSRKLEHAASLVITQKTGGVLLTESADESNPARRACQLREYLRHATGYRFCNRALEVLVFWMVLITSGLYVANDLQTPVRQWGSHFYLSKHSSCFFNFFI